MFMTIVRVLLPKSSWKHKEGAILKVPPTFLRTAELKQQLLGTTSRRSAGVLQGQQRPNSLWCLLEKITTNKKAQKSETKRRYIRIEKGGYYASDQTLLLTAQMVNS